LSAARPLALAAVVALAGCATTQEAAPPDPDPDALAPQREGVVDTYFVGFAGHTAQPVFNNEVRLAGSVVTERLGARDAVVVPAPARHEALLAALERVEGTLDPKEDVLVLWLSSHGRKGGLLQIRDKRTKLKQVLRAEALAERLRSFRWRIVVVSACFGGGFIPALADERTIVLTAADATHPSFGCKPDRELPFFGKALLEEEWSRRPGLLEAFARAREHIARWEGEGGHTNSNPQLHAGEEMKAKLLGLEAEAAR
jgi:hypothetical protein